MRTNFVFGLALAAVAAMAGFAVLSSSESGADTPTYTPVEVRMSAGKAGKEATATKRATSRRPKVVYLGGSGEVDTNQTGPYVDFGLRAAKNLCPRVVDGGIQAENTDFFQQGSYVDRGRYHILMALEDEATPAVIPYRLHLVCLKGVR